MTELENQLDGARKSIGNELAELANQLEIDWRCLKINLTCIDVARTSIGHELTELENNVEMN